MAVPCSFREPLHIPSAETLDISDDHLERIEVICRDSIEGYIKKNQGPLEKGVYRVRCALSVTSSYRVSDLLTSCNFVDFVLNEEVNERDKSPEEQPSKPLAPFHSLGIGRTESETAQSPWERGDQVRDHEDVVPVMIVCRGNVSPASTRQCSEDTNACDDSRQTRVRALGQ